MDFKMILFLGEKQQNTFMFGLCDEQLGFNSPSLRQQWTKPWAVHWLILPTAGRGALQLSLYNTDSILPSSLQPAVSHGKRVGWVYRESTVESQNNKNTQHIKIEVTYEKLLLLLNQKIAETWWGKTWLERLTLKVPTYKILVSKNLCMRGFIVWFEYRSCKK